MVSIADPLVWDPLEAQKRLQEDQGTLLNLAESEDVYLEYEYVELEVEVDDRAAAKLSAGS